MRLIPALVALALPLAAQSVTAQLRPAVPRLELGKSAQHLNFDLLLHNPSPGPVELVGVELSAFNARGELVGQKRVGGNGQSILLVPDRKVAPGASLLVFNPVPDWEADLDLQEVRVELSFEDEKEVALPPVRLAFRPAAPPTRRLRVPATGRLLIHDGHDFRSHHRRFDPTNGMAKALGISENFLRYSYDFVAVDTQGRMYKGDGERNEDWYGWGTPILAPADGVVVKARDGRPDNTKSKRQPMTLDEVKADPSVGMGNMVVLDHGDGSYSLLAHLKQGSVAVKPGQRVKAGERVGAMGFSGDAFLCHLHYDLKTGPAFQEGLPSAFSGFERFNGKAWVPAPNGAMDSGDVIRTNP